MVSQIKQKLYFINDAFLLHGGAKTLTTALTPVDEMDVIRLILRRTFAPHADDDATFLNVLLSSTLDSIRKQGDFDRVVTTYLDANSIVPNAIGSETQWTTDVPALLTKSRFFEALIDCLAATKVGTGNKSLLADLLDEKYKNVRTDIHNDKQEVEMFMRKDITAFLGSMEEDYERRFGMYLEAIRAYTATKRGQSMDEATISNQAIQVMAAREDYPPEYAKAMFRYNKEYFASTVDEQHPVLLDMIHVIRMWLHTEYDIVLSLKHKQQAPDATDREVVLINHFYDFRYVDPEAGKKVDVAGYQGVDGYMQDMDLATIVILEAKCRWTKPIPLPPVAPRAPGASGAPRAPRAGAPRAAAPRAATGANLGTRLATALGLNRNRNRNDPDPDPNFSDIS
jgi:hypothetical protein